MSMRHICYHIETKHNEIYKKIRHPKWLMDILEKFKYCPICGEQLLFKKESQESSSNK